MRVFCWGKVVEWDDLGFGGVLERMGKERVEGARAVVLLEVFKVCTLARSYLWFGIREVRLQTTEEC